MALTGTFLADFADFDRACVKAEAELQSVAASAGKVGPAIDEMVSTSAKSIESITGAASDFGTSVVTAADTAQQSFQKLPGTLGPVRGAIADLGEELGVTFTQMGLLGTAGLAIGVGYESWKIGRAIADFFELDGKISHATARMLDLGDLAGETFAAKMDVLSRASNTAGREITNFAEAVAINTKAVQDWQDTLARANAPVESAHQIRVWGADLEAVRKAGVLPALSADIDTHAFSVGELAKRYGISTGAVQEFMRQTKAALDDAKSFDDYVIATTKMIAAADAAEKKAALERAKEFAKERERIEQDYNVLTLKDLGVVAVERGKLDLEQKRVTVSSINETLALEREADTLRMGFYASETEMKIQKTHQWFDDEVAKLKASDENYKAHYNALLDIESLRIAQIEKEAAATEASAKRQVAAIGLVVSAYYQEIDAAARAAGVTVIGARPGEGPGINGAPPPGGFSLGTFSLSSAPAREMGGPVSAGSSYLVGERGPELFTPSRSGAITPNGGGGVTIGTINVTQPLGTPDAIAVAIRQSLVEFARNSGQRL